MEEDRFRTICDRLGFDVEPTLSDDERAKLDGDREPLTATNDNGDTLYYRKSLDGKGWILDIDAGGYTLDKKEFTDDDISVEGNTLVIDDASGTRPSSGYGNAGFAHAEFRLDESGATIVERH